MREVMSTCSDDNVETVVIMSSAQIGKATTLDTPIPTPSGWSTMGGIQVGDELFDEDGFRCRVVAKSPVMHDRDCYRVTFGDGSQIDVDANHRWYVEPSSGDTKRKPGVLTTAEILADLHTVRPNGQRRNNWAIPVAGALDLPEADLPISPYVLGLWLGDGSSASATITMGDEDKVELCRYIADEGVDFAEKRYGAWSIRLDPYQSDGSHCRGYATAAEYARARYRHLRHGEPFNDLLDRRPTMHSKLTALGVLNNKHVPAQYLRASMQQRLALLQGLMDSDGTITPNGICSFCATNHGLADAVFELAASLGLKPTFKEKVAKLYGRVIGPAYGVNFTAYSDTPVFRLKRKLARQRHRADPKARPTETGRRFISAIEPIPSVPVQCLAVDSPSHLFLAGRSMIPTHNTEVLNNIVGFYMSSDPCPILLVQPTIELAETWSKDRLDPMLRDTPILRNKVSEAKSRDSGNTIRRKSYPGGQITMAGANAPASLASRPVRVVLCDEVDRFPITAGVEGDPVSLARKRTATFYNRKILLTSTPTVRGVSRIEREFELSDKRYYHVACHHCDHEQRLVWSQVKWPKNEPEKAEYVCESCGCFWDDVSRWRNIQKRGRWLASEPFTGTAGFHLSEIYSPWTKLGGMARRFVEATAGGSETLKVFVNTALGESWEDGGDQVDASDVLGRLEDWGPYAPDRVLVVTAGVDVQGDRFEIERVGWGVGEESYSLDYKVLYVDPSSPQAWQQLDEYLRTPTITQDGRSLPIAACSIDTGGHNANDVYNFVRDKARRKVWAIKGSSGARVSRSGRRWPRRTTRVASATSSSLASIRPRTRSIRA